MRFLQVHLSLTRGGANVACENIETGLHRIGHQCRTVSEPSLLAASNAEHVLIHSFTSINGDRYAAMLDEVERLGIPSSVLVHDYWPICDQTNLVDRTRGWERCDLDAPCYAPCVQRRFPRVDEVKKRVLGMNLVCFSESSAEIMRKAGAKNVSVIHHGVDTSSFIPMTEQSPVPTLMFCNAWGSKAIKGCKHWEWIRNKVSNPCVQTMGETRHESMPSFYSSGDAMLFPSLWPETFGLVVIEALSCGKPVISYPVGISPQVIRDGINGFLTGTTNPNEMVDRIMDFSNLPLSKRKDMAQNARESVELEFSLETMAGKYVTLAELKTPS